MVGDVVLDIREESRIYIYGEKQNGKVLKSSQQQFNPGKEEAEEEAE